MHPENGSRLAGEYRIQVGGGWGKQETGSRWQVSERRVAAAALGGAAVQKYSRTVGNTSSDKNTRKYMKWQKYKQ